MNPPAGDKGSGKGKKDNVYSSAIPYHLPRSHKKDSLLASIIVVSYNSRKDLDRCLSSLKVTLPERCEVIVVDNASADGSAGLVAERFPWVCLVPLSHNEGFAAANNRGVELAQGRYVVALNPDTEVAPGWLTALLEPLVEVQNVRRENDESSEAHRRPVGMTTARILMMNAPTRVNTCGNTMHLTGITLCRGIRSMSDAAELAIVSDVSAVSGACFAMPKHLWQLLGGLDTDFFTYLEDTDLSLRSRLAGYRCVYTPKSVVYHSYTGTFSARKFYYLERNRVLMLLKCLRGSTLLFLLPVLGIAEFMTWGYALRNGPAHIYSKLRAYGWLIVNARSIERKRYQVQLHRRVTDREVLAPSAWRLDMAQMAGPALGRLAGGSAEPYILRVASRIDFYAQRAICKNRIDGDIKCESALFARKT